MKVVKLSNDKWGVRRWSWEWLSWEWLNLGHPEIDYWFGQWFAEKYPSDFFKDSHSAVHNFLIERNGYQRRNGSVKVEKTFSVPPHLK